MSKLGWFFAGGTALMAVGFVAACTPRPAEPSGHTLFQENCAVCHGAEGRGDGPRAVRLMVAPPDLTQLAARNDGEFPLREVMSQVDGYGRGARIHAGDMPEMGHLFDGDLVRVDTGDGILTPTPVKLVALAEYLRSIQQ